MLVWNQSINIFNTCLYHLQYRAIYIHLCEIPAEHPPWVVNPSKGPTGTESRLRIIQHEIHISQNSYFYNWTERLSMGNAFSGLNDYSKLSITSTFFKSIIWQYLLIDNSTFRFRNKIFQWQTTLPLLRPINNQLGTTLTDKFMVNLSDYH
jgi:hypothetical protein